MSAQPCGDSTRSIRLRFINFGPRASYFPMPPEVLRPRARPDAVYLVPSLHPDCPSCPESLTRSQRRSPATGETTGLLPGTLIIHNTIASGPRPHIGRKHSALTPSPRPPNAVGSLQVSMEAQRASDSCPLIVLFRPRLQYVNNDEPAAHVGGTAWGIRRMAWSIVDS